MKNSKVRASELNLGQKAYYIKERIVDNETRISNAKWYDLVTFTVYSLKLSEDMKEVVINEGYSDEQYLSVDNEDLYMSKEAALNDVYELNSQAQQDNARAIKEKKEEIEQYQREIDRMSSQLEAGRNVDDYYKKLLSDIAEGNIYNS